jgi:hypothetical protein
MLKKKLPLARPPFLIALHHAGHRFRAREIKEKQPLKSREIMVVVVYMAQI